MKGPVKVAAGVAAGYLGFRAGFSAFSRIGVHRRGLKFWDEVKADWKQAQSDLAGVE